MLQAITKEKLEDYIKQGYPVFTAVWRRGTLRFQAWNVLPRPVVVPPPFPGPLRGEGLARIPGLSPWLREETLHADRDTLVMHKTTSLARELVLAYLYAARRLRNAARLRRLEKCIAAATPDALALVLVSDTLAVYAPSSELKPKYATYPADKTTKIIQTICNLR